MRLSELLRAARLGAQGPLPADPEIVTVIEDSRQVRPGSLFVAVRGTRADGSSFAADAVARGAVAVVAQVPRPAGFTPAVGWIEVGNARRALAELAAARHDHPGRQLRVTAVTGSKGKTTTGFLLAALREAAGESTALISTVLQRVGSSEHRSSLTTPSAPDLQGLLAEAVRAKLEGVVLEVSSHALDQERVHAIQFETAVFTSFFPDHLDYHASVEDYFQAKRRLFAGEQAAARAVIGIDSRHGLRLAAERPDAITFGSIAEAAVRPIHTEASRHGTKLTVLLPGGNQAVLDSPLVGRFNAVNLLAVAAYAVARGFDLDALRDAVRKIACVPGRMEPVELGQPFTCLVDYAHMGPALEAALSACREWTSGRVIAVFGAGGNRPRERRAEMAAAAARHADLVFLTSDNPRDEDPLAILDELSTAYAAAGGSAARVLPERAEAISAAVDAARPGDTVLVAGKGHEAFQLVGSERRPFDDRDALAGALERRGYRR